MTSEVESQRLPAPNDRFANARGTTAASMVIVYLVLVTAIPSGLSIAGLGGLGRPSVLWGILLMLWWTIHRLQARATDLWQVSPNPVYTALGAFLVVVLVSFSAAMLRGQPPDQVSPAITALIRLASWSGVILVTMDGIRTHDEARRLVHGLLIAGGALAALGLAQFVTGNSLLEWVQFIPGVSIETMNTVRRGEFTRVAGTATHPLEYGTILTAVLPIALVNAVYKTHRPKVAFAAWAWWIPVALIGMSSVVAISRSATIGILIAVLATLPALPRAYRWTVVMGGAVLTAAFGAVVPGILGTILELFVGVSDDPSTQSRSDALARLPEVLALSPVIGQGFGTFLPRYLIFDNQWAVLTIELGITGFLAFAALGITGIWSGYSAARVSQVADTVAMGRALAASVGTTMVLFLFFDGLAFPQSAGIFFLVVGMAAMMRRIAVAETFSSAHGSTRQGWLS